MTNQKGGILILIIVLISILSLEVGFLSRSLITTKKTTHLQYNHTQAIYLAQSGLTFVKDQLASLPLITTLTEKDDIYNQLQILYTFTLDPGQIYAFKSNEKIYSIAIIDNIYRAIYVQNYTKNNSEYVLSTIDQLQ